MLVLSFAFAIAAIPALATENRSHVSSTTAETGSLALEATFKMISGDVPCPTGTPENIGCHPRTGEGSAPGLGKVSETYMERVERQPADCGAFDSNHALGATAHFTVAGRGEIELSYGGSAACLTPIQALILPRPFVITGGSGVYAGASGSGTLMHRADFTNTGAAGTDTWSGTLLVPGLTFDVTPPRLTGSINKTVRAPRRAKRVRVALQGRGE